MKRHLISAALAWSLMAGTAMAEIRILDYGVVCELILTNKRAAEGTESGILNVIGPGRNIDVTTAKVPAELGLSFGMRVGLNNGSQAQQIAVTVTHPPLGRRGVTRQKWTAPMSPGQTILNLFTFENEYELVKGRWTFTLQSANGSKVQKVFSITDSFAVPAVQNTCYGGQVTS